jgi:hypothetical protein
MEIIIITIFFTQLSFYKPFDLDGKKFYWENKNEDFLIFPRKSVLEFTKDSVKIIDLPFDMGPTIVYSLGIYMVKDDAKIECKIGKTIRFSLNIGQVTSYTKQCGEIIELTISENGTIVRENDKKFGKFTKNGIKLENEKVHMAYEEKDAKDLITSYYFIRRLNRFEDETKLKNCN